MASVFPTIEGFVPISLGQSRELAVIRKLAADLPDDHAVFHSVMWSSMQGTQQRFGEIDAIVVAPNGNLVLIEVKAGPVEFSDAGIHKRYDSKRKNVLGQLQLQYGALRQRLTEEGLRVYVAQLLVLPDVIVTGGTVAYPREQIVDCNDFEFLADKARVAVPECANHSGLAPSFEQVKAFLSNLFGLQPDPTARIGWLNQTVLALSDGLATWVPRISAPSKRYSIRASAGSGKTQLAIRLLQEAHAAGESVAYCCFNRPLADHLRHTLPMLSERIKTFHERAMATWNPGNDKPDFNRSETFDAASRAFCDSEGAIGDEARTLDLLIIDEAQDFAAEWITALLRRLKPDGHVYAMQDENQRLYRRGESALAVLDSAVEISSWDNFRNPRAIVDAINAFGLAEQTIVARCPMVGEPPGFHIWEKDDQNGMTMLDQVVRSLRAEEIKSEQIALLSFAGRERSALLHQNIVGGRRLRRFEGTFDEQGQPVWTDGSLLAETLFRFKGQAAPVVVLCEVDFEKLDANIRHRLFVGMTRAQWRLECVLSERAAELLAGQLQEA